MRVVLLAFMLSLMMIVIITVGCNGGTGCAANGSADNRALSSANFVAHRSPNGATYTASDSRLEGVVFGDAVEWDGCQNDGGNQCLETHNVMLQQSPLSGIRSMADAFLIVGKRLQNPNMNSLFLGYCLSYITTD
jgi:hypothetical protein